jgi:hypothetical protein
MMKDHTDKIIFAMSLKFVRAPEPLRKVLAEGGRFDV